MKAGEKENGHQNGHSSLDFTFAKDSWTQISKWIVKTLTKEAGREVHVWGNALMSSRSEWQGMVRLQEDQYPGPTSAMALALCHQDTTWTFALLSSAFLSWLDMARGEVCSHSGWGIQTQCNANNKS